MSDKTVLVVDDESDIVALLDVVLRADTGLRIVGLASDAVHAVEEAQRHRPDFVILDLIMPQSSKGRARKTDAGVNLIDEIRRASPTSKVVVYSAADTFIQDARQRSPDAIFLKTDLKGLIAWLVSNGG